MMKLVKMGVVPQPLLSFEEFGALAEEQRLIGQPVKTGPEGTMHGKTQQDWGLKEEKVGANGEGHRWFLLEHNSHWDG